MFSINQQGMDYSDNSKLPAHNAVSNTENIKVEGCENQTCF